MYVDESSWMYTGGSAAGVAVAIGLGVGAGAAGAAGTVASLYTAGSTIGGMGIAAYKLADGTATWSDALAFVPLGALSSAGQ